MDAGLPLPRRPFELQSLESMVQRCSEKRRQSLLLHSWLEASHFLPTDDVFISPNHPARTPTLLPEYNHYVVNQELKQEFMPLKTILSGSTLTRRQYCESGTGTEWRRYNRPYNEGFTAVRTLRGHQV